MQRTIQVEILDRTFPLRVHPDNEDLMRRIASYVDQKMRAVQTNLPDRPDLTVAIIASLSIAEELFAEQARSPMSAEELNKTLGSLADQLDEAIRDRNAEP